MANGFPVKANYATGDILTATNMNELSATLNYLQYMPPRNPVLNSNMSVWQRGTSFTLNAGGGATYTADRWVVVQTPATFTLSRQSTNDTTNLPFIQYCTRIQRNSGQTNTTTFDFLQGFETINSVPFAGKGVTLSFYARAGANYSPTSGALAIALYSGTGTDQTPTSAFTGQVAVINQTATLTTTWQRFTYTGTVGATATQLKIIASMTPTGTAGANDYYEITGVQLELGSAANTYMPNQPTYQGELAACQRYYWDSRDGSNQPFSGYSNSTDYLLANVRYPVTMRTTPSVTIGQSSGTNYVRRISTNAQIAITVTSYPGTNSGGFSAVYCAAAPFVAAVGYDFYILASAEL